MVIAKAVSRMSVFSNMAAKGPSKLYHTGSLSYLTTGHTIAVTRRLAVGKVLDGVQSNVIKNSHICTTQLCHAAPNPP